MKSQVPGSGNSSSGTQGTVKLEAVDAIRGWAIFLVMMAHVGSLFPELPYPMKRVTNFGWYGVQLFFIASAFTLMLSWNRMKGDTSTRTFNFFLRRLFRIAPAFYLGALLYVFVRPPGSHFDVSQLLATLLFVNAWSPDWMTTVEGRWQVVPGSWSVSVEFCFYFSFPLIALLVRNARQACGFALGAMCLMAVAPSLGEWLHGSAESMPGMDNFLFFWPPNQLVIFSLGLVLYFLAVGDNGTERLRRMFERSATPILIAGVMAILLLTLVPIRKTAVATTVSYPLPTHVVVSAMFTVICATLVLSPGRYRLITGLPWRKLGEASFAAYLLHWTMLDVAHAMQGALHLKSQGWWAIVHYSMFLAGVTASTFLLSSLAHAMIEKPMIALGRRLERRPAFSAPSLNTKKHGA